MKRRTRQALFWICVVVFSVVSPALVLRARGYRFDFVKKKFVATGAIFIKSDPEGASISVNGQIRGYTPGIFGDVFAKPSLISSILPGDYDVRVEKPGYVPWVKKLTVRPRQVTEARSIFLFAEPKPKTLYFSAITDSSIAPDGAYAAVIHEGSATSWIVLVKAADPSKQEAVYAEKEPIRGLPNAQIAFVSFSPNGQTLMAKKERKGAPPSLLTVSLDKPYRTRVMPKFPTQSDKLLKVAFTDAARVFFLDTRQTLWQWEVLTDKLPMRISTSVSGFAFHKNTLYVLDDKAQTLFAYTADGAIKTRIATLPASKQPLFASRLWVETLPDASVAFLVIPAGSKSGTVRLVDRTGNTRDLQKDAESFQISPDGKKMLVKTWNELWVRYFDDILTQPVHKKGDVALVARFGTAVKDARWHPTSGDHVIYTVPDGLFVTELDDRGGRRNTVEFARNGDITIQSVTRDGLFFTAQEHLAFVSWVPGK